MRSTYIADPDVPADLQAIFERAPGLAERIARSVGGNASSDRIMAAARRELTRMSETERIAVLDAHPRIGAPRATLSSLSREEQREGDEATMRELALLNDRYERKFGFRFVVWVNGRAPADIVPVLRERLENARERELATGIEEYLAITADRLCTSGA
jgi:2-oxo-4-hydroxy-4-carboxy--5-ureidoimidazoline (OHCU) decarboxylase